MGVSGEAPLRLRFMTWNIHGMRGADGRHDPERVARVIVESGAEVIGLQEVGAMRGPGGDDPAGALSRLTGLRAAFGATVASPGQAYGNCILSRHPIASTRNYDLSVPNREPRGCLRADIDMQRTSIHFSSTTPHAFAPNRHISLTKDDIVGVTVTGR